MDTLLKQLKGAIGSAVEGMSEEQMKWHPAGKWCTAEILEHLYLSYTGTVKGFERVLQAGKPLINPASMRQRWRTFVVLNFQLSSRRKNRAKEHRAARATFGKHKIRDRPADRSHGRDHRGV